MDQREGLILQLVHVCVWACSTVNCAMWTIKPQAIFSRFLVKFLAHEYSDNCDIKLIFFLLESISSFTGKQTGFISTKQVIWYSSYSSCLFAEAYSYIHLFLCENYDMSLCILSKTVYKNFLSCISLFKGKNSKKLLISLRRWFMNLFLHKYFFNYKLL